MAVAVDPRREAAEAVATPGVDPRDTGVASAIVGTARQMGGSAGAAILGAAPLVAAVMIDASRPAGAGEGGSSR